MAFDTALDANLYQKGEGIYNAGHSDFGSDSDSDVSRIQAAIDAAVADSVPMVLVPDSLLPYDASSVTFDNSVRMVREGQQADAYDPQAYGAAADGTVDDTAAVRATFGNAGRGAHMIISGPMLITDQLDIDALYLRISVPGAEYAAGTSNRPRLICGFDDATKALIRPTVRGVRLERLPIDMQSNATAGIDLDSGLQKAHAKVENCRLELCGGDGIIMGGGQTEVRKCDVNGVGIQSAIVSGTRGIVTKTDSKTIENQVQGFDVGIQLRGNHQHLDNNDTDLNTVGLANYDDWSNPTFTLVTDSHITGHSSEYNEEAGWDIRGSGVNVHNVTLEIQSNEDGNKSQQFGGRLEDAEQIMGEVRGDGGGAMGDGLRLGGKVDGILDVMFRNITGTRVVNNLTGGRTITSEGGRMVKVYEPGGRSALRRIGSDWQLVGTHLLIESGFTLNAAAQDVRNISSPSQGMTAYHDGSGTNTEGLASYNGTDWINQVDGSTIS